jgi:hypothetical protein
VGSWGRSRCKVVWFASALALIAGIAGCAPPGASTVTAAVMAAEDNTVGLRPLPSGGLSGLPLGGPSEDWTPEQKARAAKVSRCVAEKRAESERAAVYKDRQMPERHAPGCSELTRSERFDAATLFLKEYVDTAEDQKKLQVEQNERQAVAKRMANEALYEWGACVRDAARALARTREAAIKVVNAAFVACATEEQKLRQRLSESEGRPMDQTVEIAKELLEPDYLEAVVANRAAVGKPRVKRRPIHRPN